MFQECQVRLLYIVFQTEDTQLQNVAHFEVHQFQLEIIRCNISIYIVLLWK